MTERKADAAAEPIAVEHETRRLTRLPAGGFKLEAANRIEARAVPTGGGWKIGGLAGAQGWSLQRTTTGAGFVLRGPGMDDEIGRTMPPVGMGDEAGLKFLLLDDGRLFRIVLRGPLDGGFDLLGWETPGAYLRARPEPEGWTLKPTAACGCMKDIRAISLLFAAEVLDAEAPLRAGKS